MKIVFVSGGEATGKSTVGKKIAEILGYKYLAKDVIKERMFDTEQVSTWNYGWYEKRANDEFFTKIKSNIDSKQRLVVESNFNKKDKIRLIETLKDANLEVTEVYCYTKGLTSFRRFVNRNESKLRHSGHHDRRWYGLVFVFSILTNLKIHNPRAPLRLSSNVFELDTTDFTNIDYTTIVKSIDKSLSIESNQPKSNS